RSCALTRGTGGRSLSARPDFAPEVGPAALPPSIDELTPASFVVRVRLEDAPSVPAPRTARTAAPLPRGPPLPA
ncbi:MAG TPA: hypothetical protein VFQ39_05650, partial [Longimicrobium sp.]|nr:hypothetical protein [Longimicrobium sp.]